MESRRRIVIAGASALLGQNKALLEQSRFAAPIFGLVMKKLSLPFDEAAGPARHHSAGREDSFQNKAWSYSCRLAGVRKRNPLAR